METSQARLDAFHPAVANWFAAEFTVPTPAQALAWPSIASGRHTLVAAPTGSGKTLTAFMSTLDSLVRKGLEAGGTLPDEISTIYVSPLKALSNDIRLNLELPLAGIRAELLRLGLPDVEIRTAVRTGDTPQSERARMWRKAPHILVTTPESLYVLLGSESGRKMLSTTRSVIVDEIHAVAASKRGSHLALTLERLDALCGGQDIQVPRRTTAGSAEPGCPLAAQRRLTRIGLSATQHPIDEVARFLVGTSAIDDAGKPDCEIVDVGYSRRRDLALDVPTVPLQAVMSNEQWELVYARLAQLVQQHRTTLVFVNTRRMAERAARHLAERLGKDAVAAHHGSLAKELRLDAEQRLKRGELRVLVATASLELGIDIGDVDLVCQLGSPRSIAAFLQRVGRSGHQVGGLPKGRLFPQSRDDLVECAALLDCVRRGELDALQIPRAPLDVLAQQLVAEVGAGEWTEDALYALVRGAWPYATLARADFDAVLRMLCDGFSTRRGQRAGYLHRDAVHGRVRGRRNARMTALTSGGTIPDMADYSVVLEPQAITVGNVNEDFAIESLAGDVFQLGNASYRILRVEPGRVRVEDAHGAPPSIPFWLGEAPGRTDELSIGVSRLRDEIARRLGGNAGTGEGSAPSEEQQGNALAWLRAEVGLDDNAARQLLDYLLREYIALGALPTRSTLAIERFFDESGGTQLVIHSPYGSRINRAWGLALRKRFCRKFNFELQAAATEDSIVLSLSTSHSFPLADVSRYLHSNSAADVLVQALLDAPLFNARWRWNATNALALPRFTGGKKTAPQLQRMRSEDLLATVFPDQVACAENLVGERVVPEHPLVAQSLHDCLHEAMDIDGWLTLLRGLENGDVQLIARDLTGPSPFAAEALNARPYAFLDDAPLEERRTQAVMSRRYADADSAQDLGRLDPGAIDAVRAEAWPDARSADEMHELLMGLGFVTAAEVVANAGWESWLEQLSKDGRAARIAIGAGLWSAAERLPMMLAIFPDARLQPPIAAPAEFVAVVWARDEAVLDLVRSRLTGLGPTTAEAVSLSSSIAMADIGTALTRLESEGYVMRGRFTPAAEAEEWCERHLLARIHRYTIGRLRREIEPVEPRDFMRFLFDWQRVSRATRMNGPEALASVLAQLEGFEAPAFAWESELLPARVADYSISWLDELCSAGRVAWMRLRGSMPAQTESGRPGSVRTTPIVLLPRRQLAAWISLLIRRNEDEAPLSSRAERVVENLAKHGASFFDDLAENSHLLRVELEDALAELVARGRVNCDSFAGLRALLVPASRRPSATARRGRRASLFGIQDAGRWTLSRRAETDGASAIPAENIEHVARVLLRRYGVVCWHLLDREAAWLPSWRDLQRVYHRLEARGEIRGGRFIAGLSGEQFALPDAIGALRQVRSKAPDGHFYSVSATDPLNLVGTIVAGSKVPRQPGNRILWRDGVPVAALVTGHIEYFAGLAYGEKNAAKSALLREPAANAPQSESTAR